MHDVTENFGQTLYMSIDPRFNNPGVKYISFIQLSPMALAEELKDKPQRWTLIVAMSVGPVRTNS